jgi:protein-S-isoprenylcysteine O-methyltransferase Ste14
MTAFIIIWSIWFLSEILLNRLFRSGGNDKKDQDRGTMRVIWITIGIANSIGIIIALFVNLPISSHEILPYIGLLILTFGILFRFYSIVSLGRLFTVDVTIRNNHKVKQDGIYRFIRHPSYLGLLLSFLGFGISLNNWISLLIIIIMVTVAILNRIRIEERLLLEQFGLEYSEYMKKSYRLIPWIY